MVKVLTLIFAGLVAFPATMSINSRYLSEKSGNFIVKLEEVKD